MIGTVRGDVVVAYVLHGWGGAEKTLEYAGRKGRNVIRFHMPDDIRR